MMRPAAIALIGALWLVSCTALVAPDVTYRDCGDTSVDEVFDGDDSREHLTERCWQVDNAVTNPDDVFVEDGDLVIRLNDPVGSRREQWDGADQAPMLSQRVDGDFLVAARVEALTKVAADHCLPQGNRAGLVVRQAAQWATFLLGPFDLDNPAYDCTEGSETLPPTMGFVHSVRWGDDLVALGPASTGIGPDGESDLAICRLDNVVTFYYRDPTMLPTEPWQPVGSHKATEGPVDVGATASGADPNYDIAGHFNWVLLRRGIGSDGCVGALEGLVIPEDS